MHKEDSNRGDFKPFIKLVADAGRVMRQWEHAGHPRANIALAILTHIAHEWTDDQKSDFLHVATAEFDPTADAYNPAVAGMATLLGELTAAKGGMLQ